MIRKVGAVAGLVAGAAVVGLLWLLLINSTMRAEAAPARAGHAAVREIFCKRGWHRARRHGRLVCVRNQMNPGGPVLAATCQPTSECPPVCQSVKMTNSAGTAWVTFLVCDFPHSGRVLCTASGQATSRPDPGSVYL